MGPKLKPSGFKATYLRECLDVLSADPPVLRWRTRPPSHFSSGNGTTSSETLSKTWNRNLAGQIIKPTADGRVRVRLGGLHGRLIDAKTIIAEIGVTPIGRQQGMLEGSPKSQFVDRFADTREAAGSGPLAAVMQAAMAESGRLMGDLTVMSADADPYRMDTPAKHRIARWFTALIERFVAPDRRIHVRGVFYACVAAGDVVKPDGEAFENTDENMGFMGDAARYARWLDYVRFERIVDNKNDEPVVREAPSSDSPTAHVWGDGLEIEELDADDLSVSAGLLDFEPRQPYRLVFFGEKTSLEDVLGPLAEEFIADLYLTGGQISDTLMHRMAKDAVADGRPLVVLTFSDFDPAGYWDMPTVIGRKLQALRDLLFPTLRFTVVHAALGPEQVRDLDLPSSPLKDGEQRAEKWLELYGSEQTEIDALATLQPDVLERIAREAIAPYFDAGLADRVHAAHLAWQRVANAKLAEQMDDDSIDAIRQRAKDALDELQAVNDELTDIADEVDEEIGEPPELPAAATLGSRPDGRLSFNVLIDSEMDFAESVDRLHAHSEMVARRKP